MVSPTSTPLISTRPGEKKRLVTAMEAWSRQQTLTDDNTLPAIVISYDRDKNIAQVQPLIKVVALDDSTMSRNPLANIPVVSLGGGGFHINFPLKKGDLGWIFACDRDISTYLETLAESPPNSTRVHDFGDSLFLPDVLRKYTINSEDESNDAMVIQSTDGTTRISIWEDNIQITAPTQVTVQTPQATFTGNVTIQQELIVEGQSTLAATTVNGALENNGIDVSTHGHISESPGTRTGNMEA
jgi:hypothetical protein